MVTSIIIAYIILSGVVCAVIVVALKVNDAKGDGVYAHDRIDYFRDEIRTIECDVSDLREKVEAKARTTTAAKKGGRK